jgi:hypothetical protein
MEKIFKIKIENTEAFKQLILMLTKYVPNCSIDIDSSNGIEINQFSKDKSVFFEINLPINNFAYFRCNQNKITLNIEMRSLNAILQNIHNCDSIILYMNHHNSNMLFIKYDHNIMLMKLNEETTNFKILVPMELILYSKFRITFDIENFHHFLEQFCIGYTLVRICLFNENNITFVLDGNDYKIIPLDQNCSNIITDISFNGSIINSQYDNLFKLEYFLDFSKCNLMSSQIYMYLNDFMLILQIHSILGQIHICICPEIYNTAKL